MRHRGEGWVVVQVLLLGLYIIAPLSGGDWAPACVVQVLGWALAGFGAIIIAWSAVRLGRSLTPFPRPTEHGALITDGPYRIVRHPIYAALLLSCLGAAIGTGNLLRLGVTGMLLIFFEVKSTREEQWLKERYPGYLDYSKRVKKLIPWLY